MPFLEVLHLTGDVERRPLDKRQPLTIGSHKSNDIRIDEDGVEIMHCRVSWAKNGYEVVAAGAEPIEVNGTAMQRSPLKAGDVIRLGSVDIRYRDSENDGADAKGAAHAGPLGLKPLTDEVPRGQLADSSKAKPKAERESPPMAKSPDDHDSWEEERNPDALSNALDALAKESMAQTPGMPKKKSPKPSTPPSEPAKAKPQPSSAPSGKKAPARKEDDEIPVGKVDDDDDDIPEGEIEDGMSDRVRQALRSQQRRPGEEDPLRSPLVLSLAGGAVALLLTGAIFYFIATRQTTQQQFDAAKAAYDENNFRGAIEALQKFAIAFPKHDLTIEAKRMIGLARVRQNIEGAVPNFTEGLNQLRTFIAEQRDLENFELQYPEIMGHAKTIALGAATAAGKRFEPPLLDVSKEARTIVKTYAPKDAPPTEILDQIEKALRTSQDAIRENETYLEHVKSIEAALGGDRPTPLQALKTRRDLIVRYPKYERDKKVVELTAKILKTEQDLSLPFDADQAAQAADHPWPESALTLAFQGRTRTDEVAVGQAVIVLSQDCCYGVEFATGQPLWRRVIGFDTPFFPLLESGLPSAILFDTNHHEVVRLYQSTGKLVWRLPVGERVVGRPLLTNDTVYAATQSGRLLAIDLETGALSGELRFSQPISGPVELKDQQRMLIAGNEEVVYTVTKRPLACVGVAYLGHGADSIKAPLVTAGSYVVLIENGSTTASVRLLETEPATKPVAEVANGKVGGLVVDEPVIRGRDLFVPGIGERVSTFTLSDDPGQPPLTTGPVFQGEGSYQGPVFLLTGPDRQIWMATGAIRRLQLTTDSLQPDGEPAGPGLATQPLQYISGFLFHGRRRPFAQAVTLTRTDRDELSSDWQAILGGMPLAAVSREGGPLNLAVVNAAGQAFRIGDRQLAEGKFLTDAPTRLPLHQDLTTPIFAASLTDGRIGVAAGGPEPRIWLINAAGQIEGSPALPGIPQAPPVSLGKNILVPVEGRIHVVRQAGQSAVQDFAMPTGQVDPWSGVYATGDDQAVAVTTRGLVLLLKFGQSPRPNLSEASRVDLGQPVVLSAGSADGLIAIADASRTVTLFEGTRLEPLGKRTLDGPVSGPPWIANGKVFVEESQTTLHCLDVASDLPKVWDLDLAGSGVAGILARDGFLLIALRQGDVLKVDPAAGTILAKRSTLNTLTMGPIAAAGKVFVGTIDGTLIPISFE